MHGYCGRCFIYCRANFHSLVSVINIFRRAIKTRRCAERTSATVTAVKEKVQHRNNIRSTEYIPTIAYTVNGQEYSRDFAKGLRCRYLPCRQTLEIMVNPDKPTEINKQARQHKQTWSCWYQSGGHPRRNRDAYLVGCNRPSAWEGLFLSEVLTSPASAFRLPARGCRQRFARLRSRPYTPPLHRAGQSSGCAQRLLPSGSKILPRRACQP